MSNIYDSRSESNNWSTAIPLFILATGVMLVAFGYSDVWSEIPAAAGLHMFFALLVSLHASLYCGMPRENIADAAIIAFNFLFFILAPCLQLSASGLTLVNTLIASNNDIALANLAASVMLATYLFFRFCTSGTRDWEQDQISTEPTYNLNILVLGIFVTLCIAGISSTIQKIGARDIEQITISVTPIDLIYNKFVLFVPAAIILIHLSKLSNDINKRGVDIYFSILLVALLLCVQNPVLEKRNTLGPIALAIIYLMVRSHFLRPGPLLAYLLLSVTVALPLFALFTHVSVFDWGEGLQQPYAQLVYEHFVSINYDAWANAVAIAQITSESGATFGTQLLGTILFFVPRDLWPTKPEPTGIVIGNFLIDHHAGWFTNLSAPLSAEGHIDFGALGVAIYGYLLAIIVRQLTKWTAAGSSALRDGMGVYFSFFIIFALRGSLLVAVAYGIANLLAFLAIARFFNQPKTTQLTQP